MSPASIEDGIRTYLATLGQSDKPVVDLEAVRALKAQIDTETDPIAKLRLLSALEEEEAGRAPDTSGPRAVFVANAKAWADAEGISSAAFQAIGVPDDVLREAGFTVVGRSRRGPRARRASAPSGGTRAPAIPFEDVVRAARRLGNGWKLADLAAAIGRDPGTTRNYLNRLVSEGIVRDEGDDPRHDGRGRAPKLYGLA